MRSNKIPKTLARELARRAHQVDEYWMEDDGYLPEAGDWSIWIYLSPEFENGFDPGLGLIHEATARDAIEALRRIQPTTVPR